MLKRTIIVTGASRGIGYRLAENAIAEGYDVIGLARNFSGNEPFATIGCDVRDFAQVDAALDSVKGNKGFYGVVNAAGVLSTNVLVQAKVEDIQNIIATNLLGTIYVCKKACRMLSPLRRGRIVNISSIAAHLALKGDSVYSASKAAIETFSRSLAREVASRNITVNCIAPGPIATDMTKELTQDQIQALVDQQIIQKQMEVDEIWPMVKFLLSEDSAMVTGDVLHVGGA